MDANRKWRAASAAMLEALQVAAIMAASGLFMVFLSVLSFSIVLPYGLLAFFKRAANDKKAAGQ